MSTTDDTTEDAQPLTNLPDAVDREQVEQDRRRYGAYRSLMRLSPTNEAQQCETPADVHAALARENYREEPREWVVSMLNERLTEVSE